MGVASAFKIGKRKWDLLTPDARYHYLKLDKEYETNIYLKQQAQLIGPNRISTIRAEFWPTAENRAHFVVSMDVQWDLLRWVGHSEGEEYERKKQIHTLSTDSYPTQYYACHNDLVHHLYHIPMNQTGFGGTTFDLTMMDGTKRSIKGPWSGRAACLREYGVLATECVTEDNRSITCDDAAIIAACHERGLRVAYVREGHNDDGEMWLEPLHPNGEHKEYRGAVKNTLVYTEIKKERSSK